MGDRQALDHIDVGVAQATAPGESVCGDATQLHRRGPILTVSIADGLGHGPAAAEAARTFCSMVESCGADPLDQIFDACHAAAAATRGAAAALLRFDITARTVSFAGVGNINLRVVSAKPMPAFSVPGILGKDRRRPRVFSFPLEDGDLFLMHSDGVSGHIDIAPIARLRAEEAAARVIAERSDRRDDATCVVVRWRPTTR
jgi:phosphoserine phosphatase RsbX